MTQAQLKFATFEDYLSYNDRLEGRFQLIEGELTELPPESEGNDWIALVLRDWLVQVISRRLIRLGKCEVQVPVLQRGDVQNCFPDLVVLRSEHLLLTQKRLTITLDMPPPVMVAEIVSPGKTNRDRDYLRKQSQYSAIAILEYWIIDPQTQTVLVLALDGEAYREVGMFQGDEVIVSPLLENLELMTAQIFQTES